MWSFWSISLIPTLGKYSRPTRRISARNRSVLLIISTLVLIDFIAVEKDVDSHGEGSWSWISGLGLFPNRIWLQGLYQAIIIIWNKYKKVKSDRLAGGDSRNLSLTRTGLVIVIGLSAAAGCSRRVGCVADRLPINKMADFYNFTNTRIQILIPQSQVAIRPMIAGLNKKIHFPINMNMIRNF